MNAGAAPDPAPRAARLTLLVALLALAALAWGYLFWLARHMPMPVMSDMPGMPGMHRGGSAPLAGGWLPWTPAHFVFVLGMWAVMMVGMMTPTVLPVVMLYARVMGRDSGARTRPGPAAWFACGYLLAWSLFSLVAALAQWGLESTALLSPAMASANHRFAGVVLVVAGAYQWLPIKDACLAQCRAPLAFVQRHGGFRADAAGSLRLGLLHGAYCIGCCWALMTLLFVVGVMNLLWIAALMAFVLLEKLAPGTRWPTRIAGVAAIAIGIRVFFSAAGAA